MKALICIDGHELALKAVMTAARLSGVRSGEVVFLYVRRYRKYSRGYNLRAKAATIFADLDFDLPEVRYLHEAGEIFKKNGESYGTEKEPGPLRRALIQTGANVFEEGSVTLPFETGSHLKIREGLPHEEIVGESSEGSYDLIILGVHHVAGCHWYDIEHIPISVAQGAGCPVLLVGNEFNKGQPVLVYVQPDTSHLCNVEFIENIAVDMGSDIMVMMVSAFGDSSGVMPPFFHNVMNKWTRRGLKVEFGIQRGDPVRILSDMAPDYGLIVCSADRKKGKKRIGKIQRQLICNRYNLLLLPSACPYGDSPGR
ncbi:MAG: universal stress protein [Desulfobacterales bacterium]|nr:universal stress protein [Desulfobacterales bacterium]MDD4071274.1 universal stress protein [Desulfobacterales bacterium]MDD4393333.1 universal stress protein [Desulfobacterales bacterium]